MAWKQMDISATMKKKTQKHFNLDVFACETNVYNRNLHLGC